MKKLLQINTVVNYGSTGHIVEAIGEEVLKHGWESYIAYGRKPRGSKSKLTLNPQLHSRSATYIKRNGLLIRKTAIKSSHPFQYAYHPLTP